MLALSEYACRKTYYDKYNGESGCIDISVQERSFKIISASQQLTRHVKIINEQCDVMMT